MIPGQEQGQIIDSAVDCLCLFSDVFGFVFFFFKFITYFLIY